MFVLEDRKNAIFKFTPDGKLLTRFGGSATGANRGSKQLFAGTPQDLAIDSKGRVFVAETSRVSLFDGDGNYLDSFEVKQTFGVALNDQDELLVASRPFVVKYKLR